MSKNTLIKIGLGLMVLLNTILLFLMVQGPPRPMYPLVGEMRGEQPIMKQVSVNLNFDKAQESAYFELAKQHRIKLDEIRRSQRELVEDRLDLLKKKDKNLVVEQRILNQLQKLEGDKMKLTFEHFEDLKALCNEDQWSEFDQVVEQLKGILLNDQKKMPPPRRGFR